MLEIQSAHKMGNIWNIMIFVKKKKKGALCYTTLYHILALSGIRKYYSTWLSTPRQTPESMACACSLKDRFVRIII